MCGGAMGPGKAHGQAIREVFVELPVVRNNALGTMHAGCGPSRTFYVGFQG
jgi:hypothetical protein